jgi:lipopolysaccharide export system permease protein
MVLGELLTPFATWTGLICGLLFVMAFLRASEVLLGSAVTAADVASFTAYALPGFLVQATPAAFLAAILLGLGRLSEDGEVKAMQALGVPPAQLLVAPLALGGGLSLLLAVLTTTVQPAAVAAMRDVIQDVVRRNLTSDLRPREFHEEVSGLAFYADALGPDGTLARV